MTQKYIREQVKDIFMKYKKSIINNDTDYSSKIEKAFGLLSERKFKCLHMKYIQGLPITAIGMNLSHCRSHTHRILNEAEIEFIELLK